MKRNRLAVNLAFFLNGFIYGNWVSRLPRIMDIYQTDNGTISLVLISMSFGAFVAMPFTGWLTLKYGTRRITIISLLMYCALVPLIPVMQFLIPLMILYFTMGVFTGMLDVAMNAQGVMVEQKYQRPIMTSFHAFFSIGMALGAGSGSLFTKLSDSLNFHLIIVAALSFLCAAWVSFNLIYDKPQEGEDHNDHPLFRLPKGALIIVGIIAFCCMLAEGAMADWTVNYMEKIVKSPEALAPIALSGFALCMTIGRVFGDRFRQSYGDTKLIIGGGLVSTVGLLASIAWLDPLVVIVGFSLVGLGLSTIVPIAYSIAGNTPGMSSGVGLAMVTTIGYSGFFFGPPIIGFIADASNLRIGLSVVLLLLATMTVLAWLRSRQHAST